MSITSDGRDLVAAVPMPTGWTLVPHVVREYRYRNEWLLVVLHEDRVMASYKGYRLSEMVKVAAAFVAGRQPAGVTVTTDADGWVTSIEDVA